jgi:hypothetical protein
MPWPGTARRGCARVSPGRNARSATGRFSCGCACELCGTLATFLNDKIRRTFEWPLAKDHRQHVHSRMNGAELPVTHLTRRQGRPTPSSFTRPMRCSPASTRHVSVTRRTWRGSPANGRALATSLYDDPAAVLREDASAGLREHLASHGSARSNAQDRACRAWRTRRPVCALSDGGSRRTPPGGCAPGQLDLRGRGGRAPAAKVRLHVRHGHDRGQRHRSGRSRR